MKEMQLSLHVTSWSDVLFSNWIHRVS